MLAAVASAGDDAVFAVQPRYQLGQWPQLVAQVDQHAIAALNLTQQAKRLVTEGESDGSPNTALIDGVRRFAMDVRELDIDLIDRNLYERSCDVRWWATDAAVVAATQDPNPAALAHASQRLGQILDSYTVYFDLVLADLDGTVIANGRPRQYQNGGWISYLMTVAGPEPLETRSSAVDYDHYVTRQLQPVADAILPFVGDDFASLVDGQLGLF